MNPIWSPDGRRFAFQSDRAGPLNIFWQPADGTAAAERLTTSSFIHTAASWAPDGKAIAFIEINPETGFDIWTVGIGDRKAQQSQTRTEAGIPPGYVRLVSDGRWTARARGYNTGIETCMAKPWCSKSARCACSSRSAPP